jgi:Transposase DDE domain group 1
MGSSHTLDQLDTCFDDTHAVANAGLLLPATLAERLGIEQAADQLIDLGERAGGHRPGRKLLTLVHSMLAGGDCIDDADLLRCGATDQVLGHRVMAPSTLGTFLRSFTFGHVRQLDRLGEQILTRAWAAGAGPGDGPMTMDLDSTVCEVHESSRQSGRLDHHPRSGSRLRCGGGGRRQFWLEWIARHRGSFEQAATAVGQQVELFGQRGGNCRWDVEAGQ